VGTRRVSPVVAIAMRETFRDRSYRQHVPGAAAVHRAGTARLALQLASGSFPATVLYVIGRGHPRPYLGSRFLKTWTVVNIFSLICLAF
jgi:hypothetical protein